MPFPFPSDEKILWGRVMRTKLWLVYTLSLPSDERILWGRVRRTRSWLVYALLLPLWRERSVRTSDVLQTRVLMWLLLRLYNITTDVVFLLQSMQAFFISGKNDLPMHLTTNIYKKSEVFFYSIDKILQLWPISMCVQIKSDETDLCLLKKMVVPKNTKADRHARAKTTARGTVLSSWASTGGLCLPVWKRSYLS